MKKAKYSNNEIIKYTIRKNKMGNSMVYFNCIKIINLLLLIDLYSLIFSNPNITLIIKGTGLKNIFGNQTGQSFQKQYYPNVIYINGNKQDIIKHSYNFNLTINIVELYWNYTIINCTNMFRRNEYMTEINLFYFDASQVQTMWCMFFYCISLTSVNISNFVTSNLKLMAGMFQNCISLTSIDLSNFDTSKVINMGSMFQNCRSLSSLNLSNFDTSNLGSMEKMFEGCTNLEYLNLKKFNVKKINIKKSWCYSSIFNDIKANIVVCIDKEKNKDIIFPQIENIFCYEIDCSEDWRQRHKKIINETGQCIDKCINDPKYVFEYNDHCYENCTYGFLDDNINNNDCKCELEKCLLCPPIPLSKNLCTKCNTNYYPMEDDPLNLGEYFNCYNEMKGYYLDKENSLFKKCYQSCEICDIEGNNITHNCLTCKINFSFSSELGDNKHVNCYDKSNDEILNILKENLFSTYNPENWKSHIINGKNNITFEVTNGKNEIELLKNGVLEERNLSIIDLGECETKLKKEYNISETLSLIYIKQENTSAKSIDKNIQYEVFEPINFTNLNLSFCSENAINIYVKMDLSKETKDIYEELKSRGYDMFNINDPFYHDVCISYTHTNDVDVLLSDRIDYTYKNKDSQCQPNCQFSSYLVNSLYMNCTCNAVTDDNIIEDKKFNGKILFKSFYDVLEYSNFRILKCYKSVFTKNVLTKNYGSIIVLMSFIFYFSCLIVYNIKGITSLKNSVQKIIISKKKKKNLDKKDKFVNQIIKYDIHNPVKKKKGSVNLKNSKAKNQIPKITNKYKIKKEFSKKKSNSDSSKRDLEQSNKKNNMDISQYFAFQRSKENNKSLDAFELNDLEYEKAIIYDKRSFIKTYFDFLKREHLIIFTFFVCNDYNIAYIKYTRFIFLVVTDMAMNVFFFSDESMHKIFLNYGKYNFIQQIPQIVYTTIISNLLETILCYLSLTDKYIYQIKNLSKRLERDRVFKILRCIEFKLIIFYILIFILFIFYWYLVSVFCAVYKNTQIIFLKDALSSFVLGSVLPFIIYLIPTTFRIISLKNQKHKLEYLFKLSNIIPFF